MTLDGTNTWLLATGAGAVVVDPGPDLEPHLAAVAAAGPVALAVVTHHHADHCGGVERFRSLTGAPVLARDVSRSGGDGPLPAAGSTLDVQGLDITVLDTPGHTADSVSLVASDGHTTVLLTGDTVLGRGTTVVMHPDGNLGAYLESLEVLRRTAAERWRLLPGHGPVRPDARAVVTEYLAHRRARLDEVRAALDAGARTARDIVEIVYADVDRSLWPAAERTVEAALTYLSSTDR
ncbi:MBL fold metallo-hydrolase [Jiangella asiatica]|uniref:MBL fold metallo-hydrolase n=2 Tax=Jiangella asiatica TaxID=2530372 RepID=A0A4V2Z0D0_9ACTN|nr:MBL fold metallo-hydrolase [Jiangella asiatica]